MKVFGISRMADNERAILLLTRERPTDDDMRDFHDWNRDFRSMQRKYAELKERVKALEAALAKAIQQNECDMLLTGDELRQMRAVLSPAQQPTGEQTNG